MKKSKTAATTGKQSSTNSTASKTKTNSGRGRPKASGVNSNSNAANTDENDNEESLLEKFFTDQLKDIYYAEKKILKALPQMEEACTTEELKEAFSDHRHQTEKHVQRLEKVFTLMGIKAEAEKCEAIEGIVKECESIIDETKEGSMTRDAALIMAAQKVEHYEIATYGGLVQFAITIGKNDISQLLDKTLMEEEDTDRSLTDIAETYINIEAEEEKKYSWNREKKDEAKVNA